MIVEDVKRNGSGYYDPTAYKAIKSIEGIKDIMFRKGEIFEIDINGEIKSALVVSSNERAYDRWLNIIILIDERKGKDTVRIICKGQMYADCGRIQFMPSERLGNFIKSITDDELNDLNDALAKSLGLNVCNHCDREDDSVEIERLSANLQDAYKDITSITEENEELRKKLAFKQDNYSESAIKLGVERDLYKNLYEQLLEKMTG